MGRKAVWAVLACCWLAAAPGCARKKAPAQGMPSATADYVVNLPDVNFAAAVWKAIGKTSGELMHSELSGLTVLDARGKEIISLAGIEHFPAISRLYLSDNYIRDVTPLTVVSTLTVLDLGRNYVNDVRPLAGLANLTELDLAGNGIEDVSPLGRLISMVHLDLADNRITDIAPLAGMTHLTYVDLSHNRLTNIGALRGVHDAGGLGPGAFVNVEQNPLDAQSVLNHIVVLKSDGAEVRY
jgi:hypothetical protein